MEVEIEIEILDDGSIMIHRGTKQENEIIWQILHNNIVNPNILKQFLSNSTELIFGDKEFCG